MRTSGSKKSCFQAIVANLSIFKGDLSDQRHTLVLSPGVGQVKVGEWAEVDHVRNVLPQRSVDHVVPPDTLGLRYRPVKKKQRLGIQKWPPTGETSRTYGPHLNGFLGRDLRGRLTQRQQRMCSHPEGCWQPFRTCGSYRSPCSQSNRWYFSYSSIR